MNFLTLATSFAAGGLSTLSPCVFTVMPILAGSALQEDRKGPIAFSAGLAIAYSSIGVALASGATVFGMDDTSIRKLGGALLVITGTALLSARMRSILSEQIEQLTHRFSRGVQARSYSGLGGQFLLGALIGAIWLPCTGPTLGAALALAGTSGGIVPAWITMLVYSIGALLPFLLMAYGMRSWILKRRDRLMRASRTVMPVMGALIIALGVASITGFDKQFEAAVLDYMPDWILQLTTML